MNYYTLKWRSTHGEPELADDWLIVTAFNLLAGKPLNDEDKEALANLMMTAGFHKKGASLFNDMKQPDPRRKVTEKMKLYFTVEGHRDAGKGRTEALDLAADECGYYQDYQCEEGEEEALNRASNDYKEVQKQFNKFMLDTMKQLKAFPPPPKLGG